MIKNICLENFSAAARAALKFPPLGQELVSAVVDKIKGELQNFSKQSTVAKYNGNPLELKDFYNEDLLEEAKEIAPTVYSIVSNTTKTNSKYLINKQALALSSLLNTWMPRSNFVYRVNSLLNVGCCKSEVMDVLHRLGLCSHPNTIRAQLQSCSMQFNKEIMVWKQEIEKGMKQIKLLEESVIINR